MPRPATHLPEYDRHAPDKAWFRRPPRWPPRWRAVAMLFSLLLPAVGWLKGRAPERVVAYVPRTRFYAEPLLAQFTRETGIQVAAVFDSEAVRPSAGQPAARRAKHPQCDVFWGNEELRTRQLAGQGVCGKQRVGSLWLSQPPHGHQHELCRLAGDCGRCRWARLLPSHHAGELVPARLQPRPTDDLVERGATVTSAAHRPRFAARPHNATWRGKVALAYPCSAQPPRTSCPAAALGESGLGNLVPCPRGNQPWCGWQLVVAKLVARGEAWVD